MTKHKPDAIDRIMMAIQDYNLDHPGEEQLVLTVEKKGRLRRYERSK